MDEHRATDADAAVAAAQEWLRVNYARPVRMTELSARVALSPRQLWRRFSAATGQTPLEYLHRTRVEIACRMLESGLGTVQEISAAVGYQDAGFFRQIFRRYTGIAPQTYRRRNPPRGRCSGD